MLTIFVSLPLENLDWYERLDIHFYKIIEITTSGKHRRCTRNLIFPRLVLQIADIWHSINCKVSFLRLGVNVLVSQCKVGNPGFEHIYHMRAIIPLVVDLICELGEANTARDKKKSRRHHGGGELGNKGY